MLCEVDRLREGKCSKNKTHTHAPVACQLQRQDNINNALGGIIALVFLLHHEISILASIMNEYCDK